ncbi:hypothetical protein [Pseudoalteromonas luteoviolacea]|uniref:Uncharacterized protein n=1 Tax=Pseudoalteromonas luteoviolacea (strain 2ta16) TaxID=1353533 RepID=V4HV99_PSEL2|nr:hypothetical protein [Pseudoalteromonas luteoviolacea]ESP93723.1 hypothetical protein PL2TA16_02927 [Pseudoalteromonas luteoviolacea 2ta16]KZN41161.1 hypothetical protein N483_16245 [Pseudoalteromonas luteoviolacea NCIMB 1944]
MSNKNWSAPQSLDFIPTGKLVTFTAMHQAAYEQYIQITDENGKPITFQTLSGSNCEFPIHGQGQTVGFFENGTGKFTMRKGLQIQFANSGSHVSLVAVANPNLFFINGKTFGGGTLYVTEDGGGTDYNDTSFVLQWFEFEG